ncbi:hypothetical protein Tco_0336085 [Tanacetum coccineum]
MQGIEDLEKLESMDLDFLESMVSMDEIKASILDYNSKKALGPDGYSFMFTKKFYDLLKHDIQSLVTVAKILANRLSKVIDIIISPEQYAFIMGQQILDGPLILSETIDWYKKPGLASVMTSILINGSPTSEFSLKRGLRQRDHVSPFLFIIVMEGLHIALNDGLAANMFHGVKVGSLGLRLIFINLMYMELGFRLMKYRSRLPTRDVKLVPETVVRSLKSLRASFFWGSSKDSKKLAWVKWSNILASLDKRGLGVDLPGSFQVALAGSIVVMEPPRTGLQYYPVLLACTGRFHCGNGTGRTVLRVLVNFLIEEVLPTFAYEIKHQGLLIASISHLLKIYLLISKHHLSS